MRLFEQTDHQRLETGREMRSKRKQRMQPAVIAQIHCSPTERADRD
jgi:hypothetical protein